MVAALAFAGPALAQNRTTEAQARSYIQSAFITGAAQGILAPDVAVGPRLRERLALPEQAGRDRVYGALFRLTEEKPLRVRKTQADEIGALVARAAGRPVFALEGGEVPLVMIYDLERNAIAYVGILGAAAVAGGTKGPALEATAVRVADVQPTARETQAPLIIRLKPILFAIDSATLAAQAKAALESDALPKLVDVHEMRYVVHGHADRLGPADYNRRLSARRAHQVPRVRSPRRGRDPAAGAVGI